MHHPNFWRMLRIGAAAGAIAVVAPAAQAHIQVSPSLVATDDPVRFQVLVPNEGESPTTKVDLKLPEGLLPFSYSEVPGWKRQVVAKPDGSPDRIVWTGSLPTESFVTFDLLASTPSSGGELKWAAIQNYGDGTKVSWIGQEGSEEPAAITKVSSSAPRQNAGGEGGGTNDPATDPGSGAEVAEVPDGTVAKVAKDAGDEAGQARMFAIIALVLSVIAMALGAAGRRRRA